MVLAEATRVSSQFLRHDAVVDALSHWKSAIGRVERAVVVVEGGGRRCFDATRLVMVEHELKGGAHGGRGRVGFRGEETKEMEAAAVAGEGVGLASRGAGDRTKDGLQKRAVVEFSVVPPLIRAQNLTNLRPKTDLSIAWYPIGNSEHASMMHKSNTSGPGNLWSDAQPYQLSAVLAPRPNYAVAEGMSIGSFHSSDSNHECRIWCRSSHQSAGD
eukprot:6193919-Pleurochrysis_carterae.AAC.7